MGRIGSYQINAGELKVALAISPSSGSKSEGVVATHKSVCSKAETHQPRNGEEATSTTTISGKFYQISLSRCQRISTIGQQVRARVSRKWIQGKVIQICQQPNSYIVRLVDGRQFRRTRQAINVDRSPRTGVSDS